MCRIPNLWLKSLTYFFDEKSEKYTDFSQPGKITIQLYDEYYKIWENAKVRKFYDNFH